MGDQEYNRCRACWKLIVVLKSCPAWGQGCEGCQPQCLSSDGVYSGSSVSIRNCDVWYMLVTDQACFPSSVVPTGIILLWRLVGCCCSNHFGSGASSRASTICCRGWLVHCKNDCTGLGIVEDSEDRSGVWDRSTTLVTLYWQSKQFAK